MTPTLFPLFPTETREEYQEGRITLNLSFTSRVEGFFFFFSFWSRQYLPLLPSGSGSHKVVNSEDAAAAQDRRHNTCITMFAYLGDTFGSFMWALTPPAPPRP